MKEAFVDKLKEFDFLIGDKEEKINKINQDIIDKNEEIKKLESKINKLQGFSSSSGGHEVVLPKYADLEDGNLLTDYKKIKDSFNFNASSMIKQLSALNSKESIEIFKSLENIKAKFSFDTVYKVSTYQSDEQLTIVKELLNAPEKKIVGDILEKKNFNIKKFIVALNKRIVIYNPKIKVFVGDKKVNYNNIDPNVETVFSSDITEGFKIEYKGVIYDYSI